MLFIRLAPGLRLVFRLPFCSCRKSVLDARWIFKEMFSSRICLPWKQDSDVRSWSWSWWFRPRVFLPRELFKNFFLGWRKKNFFYTRHKFGRWDFPLEAIKLLKIFFEVETRVKLELDQILIRYNQPTLSSLLPGKQPKCNSWRKRMNCWQLLNW